MGHGAESAEHRAKGLEPREKREGRRSGRLMGICLITCETPSIYINVTD